ncbi:hypothetical protein B0T10DRAFT_593483 [Thelonectria olida]|uniref:Myb-like domain-containing protein n=1 Tax=Thelonectria olida TaxID=1576542 RepID=A0A9P8VQ93_9HYPO|nr:hypothetical protein B0T10DRAFT_593483 [Thelonectria olida]
MSLTFKPYDPFRQKQRAERRRHAKPRERTEEHSISAPPDGERLSPVTPQRPADDRNCSHIEESDSSPTDGLDGVGDPYANFPSVEECLSFCSSVTDVSSPCTPASACSPRYQIDAFVWRGKDSTINIKDDRPDSSSQTANLNISNATPKPALHGDDLRQSCELPVSVSNDARAQEVSVSKLNSGLLAQSAEALGVLASAAIAERESVVGISSTEIAPGPGTETFSSKRSLPECDVPGGSEGHDSEVYRSPKRPRPSGFKSHSSPRLESTDICPIPADPRVNGSANQSSQVPGDSSPQFRPGSCVGPSSIASGLASQSAELISMPTEQAESVRLELLVMQKMISSLLAKLGHGQAQRTLPDGSVQCTLETRDGTEGPVGDDSNDDSHSTSHSHSDGDSDNDSDGDSDGDDDSDGDGDGDDDSACDASEFTTGSPKGKRHRSTQRCRWTKQEEDLLRRLKNVGMLSDFQIARKLNRSENGVKQHWGIMLGKNKGQFLTGKFQKFVL